MTDWPNSRLHIVFCIWVMLSSAWKSTTDRHALLISVLRYILEPSCLWVRRTRPTTTFLLKFKRKQGPKSRASVSNRFWHFLFNFDQSAPYYWNRYDAGLLVNDIPRAKLSLLTWCHLSSGEWPVLRSQSFCFPVTGIGIFLPGMDVIEQATKRGFDYRKANCIVSFPMWLIRKVHRCTCVWDHIISWSTWTTKKDSSIPCWWRRLTVLEMQSGLTHATYTTLARSLRERYRQQ